MTPVVPASLVDSRRHTHKLGKLGKLTRTPQKAGASAHGCGSDVPSMRRSSAMVTGTTAIIPKLPVLLVLLVLAWRGECMAYIDPNAGGFLSQVLVPLASIFLSFLFYCRKEIRRFAKSARDRWRKIDSREAPHEAGK
jgi:hypothetical protein